MRPLQLPFGVRFLILLVVAGAAKIAVAVVLVLVGLLVVRLTVFTPNIELALIVGVGLVIGLGIVIGLILATGFSGAVVRAAKHLLIACLVAAVVLIGLFAADVIPAGVLLIAIAILGLA